MRLFSTYVLSLLCHVDCPSLIFSLIYISVCIVSRLSQNLRFRPAIVNSASDNSISLDDTIIAPPPSSPPSSPSPGQIIDRVAAITDTQYTPQLIPLLLHYNAVLGPEWPIVFFTTQALIDKHLVATSPEQKISSAFKKALAEKRIQTRIVPERFNLTDRQGVNVYLADRWMWEELAPAKHVLIFQTDAILCANSPYSIDDYLQYDFVGAYIPPATSNLYNGGLSLRNRTLIMEILDAGNKWKPHVEGEDVWFSKHMGNRNANLPSEDVARNFALQYPWNFNPDGRPIGYHKIHKNVPTKLHGIKAWCPEIMLTQMGTLMH